MTATDESPVDRSIGTARPSRRSFLQFAGLGALALALEACGSDGDDTAGTPTSTAGDGTGPTSSTSSAGSGATTSVAATTALGAADFERLGTCTLLPEKTAGPFPLDQQLVRRDITEGLPGHPMRLGLRVLDESCAPVPGANVEIWHTDATGDYSAFADGGGGKDEGPGTTFLRGTQSADDAGIVEFLTICPGWYPGRAVHIHLRVHLEDDVVTTSQLFFDPEYLESVYASAPYAEFGSADTSLAEDNIAGDPASEGTVLVTAAADTSKGRGTLALLNLGIEA